MTRTFVITVLVVALAVAVGWTIALKSEPHPLYAFGLIFARMLGAC